MSSGTLDAKMMSESVLGLHVLFEEPPTGAEESKDIVEPEVCEWNLIDRTQLDALANCGDDRAQLLTHLKMLVRTWEGTLEVVTHGNGAVLRELEENEELKEDRGMNPERLGRVGTYPIPDGRHLKLDKTPPHISPKFPKEHKKEQAVKPITESTSDHDTEVIDLRSNEKNDKKGQKKDIVDSIELAKERFKKKDEQRKANLERAELELSKDRAVNKLAEAKSHVRRRYLSEKAQSQQSVHYKTDFVAYYLLGWYQYAMSRSFTAPQTSAILEIAYKAHAYCVESSSTNLNSVKTPAEVVDEFKRLMIAHSVLDVPRGIRVFAARQCVDTVEYFIRSYVKILPIVKIIYFPNSPICSV